MMKTFLLVKLGFLPAVLFWGLAAMGHVGLGLDLGAALGALVFGLKRAQGHRAPMEEAFFGFLVAAALARHAGFSLEGQEVAASLAVLGATGLVTSLRGHPWTATYAAREYAEMQASPAFHAINQILSALWAVIFLALASFAALGLDPQWSRGLTGLGAILSIFGPKAAVQLMLRRAIRNRESYHWPTPTFGTSPADDVDIAVIGAGLGGLTAAALLAQAGLKVLVAEAHVVPGGFCHSWRRKIRHDGATRLFRFDSGVHDISGVRPGGTLTGLLARLGAEITWLRMPQSAWIAEAPFPVAEDWRQHAADLGERFPASRDGLRAFFDTMKTIHDDIFALGEGNSGVPLPPERVADMLAFPRAHPTAARWMDRPFAELVTRHVADPAAQAALYHLGGYITDRPGDMTVLEMAPLYGYYFHGGFYPKGGSGRLADVLANALTRFGGELLLKSPVTDIIVEGGATRGIRLASGREIRARAVISNADLKRTFLELLPAGALPRPFRDKIASAEPATSAFMVHLGLRAAPDITPIASVISKDGLEIGLVSPSLVDPDAAPKGYATLELIALIPHDKAQQWFPEPGAGDIATYRKSPEYHDAKQAFGDQLIDAAERLITGLRRQILLRVDASPLTFARYDRSSQGAIYGLAQSHRFQGTKSPLPGLYLAGAGNQGPGVEAVMIAGARAAATILPGLLSKAPPAPHDPAHNPL